MVFKFEKATKEKAKLRAALFGPSGSGKTFSALRIATGLGRKIAVIDTERGRARKYADLFEFDVLELLVKNIENYIKAIETAAGAKYDILIIDSLSHAWKELLEEVDFLTENKFRGNNFRAWSVGTPKQKRFIEALLDFPGHVIATMRSKTEWVVGKDDETGKVRPMRVGLAPEQGKGIEYEFDLLLEINHAHVASVIKDSTGGKFQDVMIERPGEDFGRELAEWLGKGKKNSKKIAPELYGEKAAASYRFLKESLENCHTKEEVHLVAEKYTDSINQLPLRLKKDIVTIGKKLKRTLPSEKSEKVTAAA